MLKKRRSRILFIIGILCAVYATAHITVEDGWRMPSPFHYQARISKTPWSDGIEVRSRNAFIPRDVLFCQTGEQRVEHKGSVLCVPPEISALDREKSIDDFRKRVDEGLRRYWFEVTEKILAIVLSAFLGPIALYFAYIALRYVSVAILSMIRWVSRGA